MVKEYAVSHGESTTGFIVRLVTEAIERDSAKAADAVQSGQAQDSESLYINSWYSLRLLSTQCCVPFGSSLNLEMNCPSSSKYARKSTLPELGAKAEDKKSLNAYTPSQLVLNKCHWHLEPAGNFKRAE